MTLRSFAYYGTVGNQVQETMGAVNRLLVCAFDEARTSKSIETRKANILAAKVKVTLDISQWLFVPTEIPPSKRSKEEIERMDALQENARANLEALPAMFGEAWDYVDSIILTDEPNLPEHAKSEQTLEQAARLVRSVFPGKKLAAIYYTGRPLTGLHLFDWAGFDRYKDGDKVLWKWPKWLFWLTKWGWANHMQRQLRDDQELILVPGGGELRFPNPTPSKWFKYAKKQHRNVHIIAFIWRAPKYADEDMAGIVYKTDLANEYQEQGAMAFA